VIESKEHFFSQLNMRVVDAPGTDLAIELELDPTLSNPRGALQGGLVATLADIAAGRAVIAELPEGHGAATSDLTIHYLAPISRGPARAEATILRRGRTSIVVRVDIFDGGADRLCATSTVAFTPLAPITT
jgi:uncharacterized protein (TIGR00369 family)